MSTQEPVVRNAPVPVGGVSERQEERKGRSTRVTFGLDSVDQDRIVVRGSPGCFSRTDPMLLSPPWRGREIHHLSFPRVVSTTA